MTPINDIPSLLSAIQTFSMLQGSLVPTTVQATTLQGNPQAAFIAAASSNSPVVAICDTAEALYAYRDEITDTGAKNAAMTLAGQCAMFAAQLSWHGMGLPISTASGAPSRGVGICWAMQRELGETAPTGTTWPAESADPAVDSRFLKPQMPGPSPS